jgi:gas vesicle protein
MKTMRLLAVLVAALFLVSVSGSQVRKPDTVPGTPGQWPEQSKHNLVDATQLKSEAKELQGMAQELTPQIDQIGQGKLPKELIENLKKIEKLAKHIRGEIS